MTGSSRGIGRGTALALAAEGCDVMLTGRDAQALEEVAGKIRAMGRRAAIATLDLREPIESVPAALAAYNLTLADDRKTLIYSYDTKSEHTGITSLLDDLRHAGIRFKDLHTTQSSLEDIFVGLLRHQS